MKKKKEGATKTQSSCEGRTQFKERIIGLISSNSLLKMLDLDKELILAWTLPVKCLHLPINNYS